MKTNKTILDAATRNVKRSPSWDVKHDLLLARDAVDTITVTYWTIVAIRAEYRRLMAEVAAA